MGEVPIGTLKPIVFHSIWLLKIKRLPHLLTYRYLQLDRAIENAEKLGFTQGAALYPMVTMNGEECHNEWEITFEEIHRNSAIAFAIFTYTRYTGDLSYIPEMGLEVLIGISRFWVQRPFRLNPICHPRGNRPNEYENNINNNWYTNYSNGVFHTTDKSIS